MGGTTRSGQISPATQQVIRLRRARAADRGFIRSLYLVNARAHLSVLGPVDEEALRARFERTYRQYQASIICAGPQEIGWLQVRNAKDPIHIGQLHLIESHRNCGIGGRLIADILARAKESARPVELNVIRGNPAIHLYQRLGFRLVGEDPEKLHMRWDPSG
jgi:ribosomal protein S18 acetylase RimI-like enzyme